MAQRASSFFFRSDKGRQIIRILHIEVMNRAVYDAELMNIYNKTTDDPLKMFKLYNVINVATVVNNIRQGGIITEIEKENAESIHRSLQRLGLFARDIRSNVNRDPIFCFVRENDAAQRDLLASMVTALNRASMPPSNHNLINNTVITGDRNLQLGELLGYLNTMNRRNLSFYTIGAGIEVIVNYNGTTTTLKIFPQKITEATDLKTQILTQMATQIAHMPLPDGFTILSSRAMYMRGATTEYLEPVSNSINAANNVSNVESVFNSNNNANVHTLRWLTGGKRRKRQTRSKRSAKRKSIRSSRR